MVTQQVPELDAHSNGRCAHCNFSNYTQQEYYHVILSTTSLILTLIY